MIVLQPLQERSNRSVALKRSCDPFVCSLKPATARQLAPFLLLHRLTLMYLPNKDII